MDYKSALLGALDRKSKDECIELAMEAVEKGIFTVPTLYEDVLKTALYIIDDCNDDDCIWNEHVKTSIVRSIIECMYPQIIKLKKQAHPMNKKIVLACPEKEYHEIGLRMIDDFFNILGYETIYVGTNTPKNQILNVVLRTKPDYVAISVTDYYLLFEVQEIVQNMKKINNDVKVIIGGTAFKDNIDSIEKIGGDLYFETFQELTELRNGDAHEIIL